MGAHDGTIAVAVSGGSDSLALMHLLRGFAQQRKSRSLVVLTVDHGLRKFSARDAKQVAAWAKQAGLKAKILTWTGAKPKSGIEAAAREARYRLMGEWLTRHKIDTLFVGHTGDDQAETFLLRLARGSGLDGLAAMRTNAPGANGRGGGPADCACASPGAPIESPSTRPPAAPLATLMKPRRLKMWSIPGSAPITVSPCQPGRRL